MARQSVMDFYGRQERAKRNTFRLVLLYAVAVLGIVVLVHLVITALFWYSANRDVQGPGVPFEPFSGALFVKVGAGVLAIVGLGTLTKLMELSSGGATVAKALGGRLLNIDSRDPAERKALNVVEEMAIASGVPVPSVYMLEGESAINAFAAGMKPEDAVIGLTRGCVERLTRDELQGVVAHEFSHVLHGDMRLNVRLIGILHGILMISLVGSMLMRVAFYSGGSSSRRKGDSGMALIVIGIVMWILGGLGYLFGGLIKAAVSRQREFLADASAVAFTRQPEGIAGALKKIGARPKRAELRHAKAQQFSHMYFGEGVSHLSELLATHPPLAERILAIDPGWNGEFPEDAPVVEVRGSRKDKKKPKGTKRAQGSPAQGIPIPVPIPGMPQGGAGAGAGGMPGILAGVMGAAVGTAVEQVGAPSKDHLDYAVDLLARLPESLKKAVHDDVGARAVVYALLLDKKTDIRKKQWARLDESGHRGVVEQMRTIEDEIGALDVASRIPLLDLAVPALRSLDPFAYERFRDNVVALALADQQIDTFEWLLRRMMQVYLEPHFSRRRSPKVSIYNLAGVRRECSVVLAVLARMGHGDEAEVQAAFAAGVARLGISSVDLLPAEEAGLRQFDVALDKLREVSGRCKRSLLEACGACIAADKKITAEEGELFRGVADVLECPMPPLLPGQRLA